MGHSTKEREGSHYPVQRYLLQPAKSYATLRGGDKPCTGTLKRMFGANPIFAGAPCVTQPA